MNSEILLGLGEEKVFLDPAFANRHGLIAGATGTGKTITLQVLAEGFSQMGVPVFLSDIKGDLSGISQPGKPHKKIDERVSKIGIENFSFSANPVVFWDLFGEQGHPVRTTISDMGPTLLARLMNLNETQEGVLNIIFEFADDEGMLLLDLKDLRSTLKFVGDNAKNITTGYGHISKASIGAIQRRLLVLEQEGADQFFGEPGLELNDLIKTNDEGLGYINILAADKLMHSPRLYATFLLWLLSELFEELPEVGDLDKPRFVFFFDEAHLLFKEAPKALIEKVEMVVRLIRSKGVGIYFITQSPLDIPESVLGQLGNRVQHALRAFTPRDQKAVRTVAQTMRANPNLDTQKVIGELGVGEALISVLQERGIPSVVQKTLIVPPVSQIGPVKKNERQTVMDNSWLEGRYDTTIDRRSAYEHLVERSQKQIEAAEAASEQQKELRVPAKKQGRKRQSIGESFMKSAARAIGSRFGRQIVRGILGSIFRGR
ncbi:Uncharacterized protein YjgR [hydrothermal vent metagenome]|uniref:Uncharacterized protein YjgR n=1 Tax=hydrothermal vent metagenome TaxID=652676 RepID=A0A3B0WDR3_9ZZZZ